jgi:two-component system, OmpR family, KDP operon response regulator KdpE
VLLRRFGRKPDNSIIDTKELSINLETRLVTINGKRVTLRPKEFEVLKVLVLARGRPVSPQYLLQVIWGPDVTQAEVLRTVVHELRGKIEAQCSQPIYIRSQPRVGYRFVLPE